MKVLVYNKKEYLEDFFELKKDKSIRNYYSCNGFVFKRICNINSEYTKTIKEFSEPVYMHYTLSNGEPRITHNSVNTHKYHNFIKKFESINGQLSSFTIRPEFLGY